MGFGAAPDIGCGDHAEGSAELCEFDFRRVSQLGPGFAGRAVNEGRALVQIEIHEGDPGAALSILVSVEGDDAKRLEQIATERGQQPSEVVSGLIRGAS